jgi:hypothetical protein
LAINEAWAIMAIAMVLALLAILISIARKPR